MVGEDGEGEDHGQDGLGEDGRRRGRPLLGAGGGDAPGDGAVVLVAAEIDRGPLHGVRGFHQRGVFGEEGVVGEEHARLHVGVGFFEEEVAEEDAHEEHAGADEVGEEVGEAGEDGGGRENGRVGLGWVGEEPADHGADDGADAPDEGH